MRKFGISEFSTKPTNFYNLDMIISVGYRVNSLRGTQFRIWATQRLREYIVKGFTMDNERLRLKMVADDGKMSLIDVADSVCEIRDTVSDFSNN